MILPLYKPVGASTHQLAARAGRLHNQKATHTGTLDPMADGVVIVLIGQDRYKKSQLSDVKKIYQYQMILGLSTDSHDLMGVMTDKQLANFPSLETLEKSIRAALPKYSGEFYQRIPDFSAKRIQGSSYMQLAKQSNQPPLAKEKITIFDHQLLSVSTITQEKIKSYIQETIPRVQGDFRQQLIVDQWLSQSLPTLPLVTLTVTTSKRAYVRALVRDIAHEVGLPATTFKLTRTKNGPYAIKDCLCLPQAGII